MGPVKQPVKTKAVFKRRLPGANLKLGI